MTDNIIKQLAKNKIYSYGSSELLKFESHMTRYFEREYKRWRGNRALPEEFGISSFKGNIAQQETHHESIEHYNKTLNIYQAFLDKDYMAYTMAYYGATDTKPNIDKSMSLDDAQINKFELIIERAQIKDGQSILELGCGFGGFAKYKIFIPIFYFFKC